MDSKTRIDAIVAQLNAASDAYYGGQEEQMTNYEWDALFDELTALEKGSGYIRADSPTQVTSHSGDEMEGEGEKELHEYPALSLAKTKQVAELQAWAGERAVWLSWKLDGSTLVVTYDGGRLTRVLTRGNGTVGTNITYMAAALRGIPATIGEKGHLVVRGEATISYADFEAINDTLEDADDRYANPRNLAAGTLALDRTNLDKVRERCVSFTAFTLVHTDKPIVSWGARMDFLDSLGFLTVERERTDATALPDTVARWTHKVDSGEMGTPVDGLVITYDDTDYAATGSVTGHHATRGGLAYKWADASADTMLDHIEWSCAASTITPVAVFAPVQLEGTTVTRASLCNVSELERLGIGADGKTKLRIIKANKIIPKCIAVVEAEGNCNIPAQCPVCGAATEVRVSPLSAVKTLRCTDPDCPARHLKRFARFVSKGGMDIDGLSVQTLHAFVNHGLLRDFADIYHLGDHTEEIVAMDGLGQRSCANLLTAIEKSRRVSPVNLIFALCIPNIGVDAGKKLIAALGTEGLLTRIERGEGFEDVDGIGAERSGALLHWFAEEKNSALFKRLLAELTIENIAPKSSSDGMCKGMTFVITGDVHHFKNREEFKQYVEQQGGKVAGSVSGKTSYLVSNDFSSNSAKAQKAAALGIPILTEDDFIVRFGTVDPAKKGEDEEIKPLI